MLFCWSSSTREDQRTVSQDNIFGIFVAVDFRSQVHCLFLIPKKKRLFLILDSLILFVWTANIDKKQTNKKTVSEIYLRQEKKNKQTISIKKFTQYLLELMMNLFHSDRIKFVSFFFHKMNLIFRYVKIFFLSFFIKLHFTVNFRWFLI